MEKAKVRITAVKPADQAVPYPGPRNSLNVSRKEIAVLTIPRSSLSNWPSIHRNGFCAIENSTQVSPAQWEIYVPKSQNKKIPGPDLWNPMMRLLLVKMSDTE
jgi:hypothetical protein